MALITHRSVGCKNIAMIQFKSYSFCLRTVFQRPTTLHVFLYKIVVSTQPLLVTTISLASVDWWYGGMVCICNVPMAHSIDILLAHHCYPIFHQLLAVLPTASDMTPTQFAQIHVYMLISHVLYVTHVFIIVHNLLKCLLCWKINCCEASSLLLCGHLSCMCMVHNNTIWCGG